METHELKQQLLNPLINSKTAPQCLMPVRPFPEDIKGAIEGQFDGSELSYYTAHVCEVLVEHQQDDVARIA